MPGPRPAARKSLLVVLRRKAVCRQALVGPAPRHHRGHHRPVLPDARRQNPDRRPPQQLNITARGGDFHLATSGDLSLAIDTAATPPEVASAQKQLPYLQWPVPALTGALVVVSSFAGERSNCRFGSFRA